MSKKNKFFAKQYFLFDELGRLVIGDQLLLAKINGTANLNLYEAQPNARNTGCNPCGNIGCGHDAACKIDLVCGCWQIESSR
jgi:hypothetical protein